MRPLRMQVFFLRAHYASLICIWKNYKKTPIFSKSPQKRFLPKYGSHKKLALHCISSMKIGCFCSMKSASTKCVKRKILEKYTVKNISVEAWGEVDVLVTKTFLTPLLID